MNANANVYASNANYADEYVPASAVETIAAVTSTPYYSPSAIARLMRKHDLSERGLAAIVNVMPSTVRSWLTGESSPCGLSRRLLQLLDVCPEIIDTFVDRAVGV